MALTWAATRIRCLDARVTIALSLLAGLLIWRMTMPAVAVCGLGLGIVLLLLIPTASVEMRLVRSFAWLIGIWIGLKLALEALGPDGLDRAALAQASLLGLRLFVLLCLGLAITLMASPRALGLALAWYGRPWLGRRAWRLALALALMVHFLPLAWRAMATVRAAIGRRCSELAWHRRAALLPQAAIRVLAQSTWDQTLALAARGLDSAGAWQGGPPLRRSDVAVGLSGAGLLWALALI